MHSSALNWRPFPHWMLLAIGLAAFHLARGQTPEWIWHEREDSGSARAQTAYFRKHFRTPPLTWNARLTVAGDQADIYLNGKFIARCERWKEPARLEVSVRLNQGENVLAIRSRSQEPPHGLLVHLNMGGSEGQTLVSDRSWLSTSREETDWNDLRFNAAHWRTVESLGRHGDAPWGEVLFRPSATPAESLTLLPGFRAELLRSAEPGEGSWICLAVDPQGRIVLSAQSDTQPLLRLTLDNQAEVTRVETIPAPVRHAMGLLFAHGSLYVNGKGPQGAGLYRLIDQNNNDQFDPEELRLLKKFQGGGEHGYHAVALGPEGMIYVLNGNGVQPPEGVSPRSPHRHYAHDMLSPGGDDEEAERQANPARALQGYVLRTDPEGKEWQLILGGLRNSYDFDFNPAGELFTFDSDMEWDWGTPWYRPTRILHCVSGAEFGWRNGIAMWPDDYPDSVPAVADLGIGSPTGVRFGTRSHFPLKYQRALYAMDWSYGRILAVHLEPQGASYRAGYETFLQGRPLNVTDLDFGRDGAMYFVTGGRGTQSGLYRVSHVDAQPAPVAAPPPQDAGAPARALRRQLEAFHGRESSEAIDFLWPHLGSEDRALRYAARIALESQPASQWRERLHREDRPAAALTAMLALARIGGKESQAVIFEVLRRFPFGTLGREQQSLLLRIVQVSWLRQGRPATEAARDLIAHLDRHYPSASWPVNRELSRLLSGLGSATFVSKTLNLLDSAPTLEQQLHYVNHLRDIESGWTLQERQRYFEWWLRPREHSKHPADLAKWFAEAGRDYVDGASLNQYLANIRQAALSTLSEKERASLTPLLEKPIAKARLIPARPRSFVKEWTLDELLPNLDSLARGRDFTRGRQAFADVQCLSCHRFGNDGAAVGQELTAVASKYSRRDILESILDPSKVISDQYQNVSFYMEDGDVFTGRVVHENEDEVVVETDFLAGTRAELAKSEIRQRRLSVISPMPEGLLNVLTKEEILDLLAYLESGGNPKASVFQEFKPPQ